MMNLLYHFNYFIVLVTGIFDSLAIKTKLHYNLQFEDDKVPARTSLHNNAGREFLSSLRDKDKALREHINHYVDFISLIYSLREQIIHREMLQETGFHLRNSDGEWKANFIWTNSRTVEAIRRCGDRPCLYDSVSKWGVYESGRNYFFDPFHFAESATKKLCAFVDQYLELLGYGNWPNQVGNSNPSTAFQRQLHLFRRCRLGF